MGSRAGEGSECCGMLVGLKRWEGLERRLQLWRGNGQWPCSSIPLFPAHWPPPLLPLPLPSPSSCPASPARFNNVWTDGERQTQMELFLGLKQHEYFRHTRLYYEVRECRKEGEGGQKRKGRLERARRLQPLPIEDHACLRSLPLLSPPPPPTHPHAPSHTLYSSLLPSLPPNTHSLFLSHTLSPPSLSPPGGRCHPDGLFRDGRRE